MKFGKLATLLLCLSVFVSNKLWGFSVPIHEAITKESLSSVRVTIADEERQFSENAVKAVQKANGAVDNDAPAKDNPAGHFTNEQFQAGAQRLIDTKAKILNLLRADTPDGEGARKALGTALHAIQDFYAHTTWIESGKQSMCSPELWIAAPGSSPGSQ